MAVAVNMPQRRQEPSEDEKLMQIIMTGLKVADTVYGIKDAGAKRDLMAQNAESAKAQQIIDNQYKDKTISQKQQEIDILNRTAPQKARKEALELEKLEREAAEKRIPEQDRKSALSISEKNANKIAIMNQIDSVLKNTENLSKSEQLQQYKEMIKTLNSKEGSDAVGSEESRRLASKLEFAFGNFTDSSQEVQFGRDLPGFRKDAANTSAGLRDAILKNQALSDGLLGTPGRENFLTKTLNAGNKETPPPDDHPELAGLSQEDQLKKIAQAKERALIKEQGIGGTIKGSKAK